MGGGGEDDDASTLFAEAAGGGDVVVLRASGSLTSYPDYFLTALSPSPPPASAVTVLTTVPARAGDTAVMCRTDRAEAVWLAGGDQWDYLGGWPEELHSALARLHDRGSAVGGTSAGAVSLGEAAFDARFGTVTSREALQDPAGQEVSVAYPSFAPDELKGVLVDSHFREREREGRLLAFLARFLVEKGRDAVVGVGLDEGVALVLEGDGYLVFGPPDKRVTLYRVTGPATVRPGSPLHLQGIERVRLAPGTRGVWPVEFPASGAVRLRVRSGVVEVAG
jgi:hypothetical protein